jgi:hypothetical protein
MRSPGTRLLDVFGLVVLGALVGACSDEPTSVPSGAAPVAATAATGAMQVGLPARAQNTMKYRDAGKPHATGRAGNASLNVRALYGRDGRTTLQVTTGAMDAAAAAPGNIERLQVKLLEANKLQRPIWTRNYSDLAAGGSWSQTLPGVGPGRTLQVTAHVTGIDPRTDVIVVREKAKRLPDLTVSGLDAPAKAAPGAPVDIAAVVREINGDVGARANCVLSVDGVEVDRANGIWVDASSAVSCAFTYRFVAGSHAVRVSVEGVRPGEWDATNNEVAGSIAVEQPSELLYTARVEDVGVSHWQRSEINERFEARNGPTSTDQRVNELTQVQRWQKAKILAFTPWTPEVKIAFPLQQLEFSHSSGSLATAGSFTGVAEQWSDAWTVAGSYEMEQHCADGYGDGALGRVFFEACVLRRKLYASGSYAGDPLADDQWYNSTTVETMRRAGEVTYMSREFERLRYENLEGDVGCTSEGPDGSDYCYFYNQTTATKDGSGFGADGQMPVLGTTYSMGVTIAGAVGAAQTTRADVALDQPYRPFQQWSGSAWVFTDLVDSRNCVTQASTEEDWTLYDYRYSYSSCDDVRDVATGRTGSASREAVPGK